MKLTSAVVLCALAFASVDFAAAATAAPAGTACGAATTGSIIHDDGSVDTNYWLNGRADAAAVEKFTPTSYPNSFSTVCFQFITTNANQSTLNFTILVFDDDGTDGAPGTLLGSKAVTSNQLHVATSGTAYPFAATFEAFDISDLSLSITSGSVYIGATWDSRSTAFPNAKLGLDTSAGTPVGGGYRRLSSALAWDKIVNSTPAYRALFVRAVQSVTLAPSLSKAFAPSAVAAQTPSTLTITLSNPVAVPATLSADLVDLLPTGLVVATVSNASTTCGGAVLANAGSSSITLSNGAVIPPNATCTVSVDVAADVAGTYVNTIPAGALQTDQGNNANAAEATLTVSVPAGPPTIAKAFAPSTVAAGGTTTLTITLGNGNAAAATLTAALTDTFPAGIVLANLPSPSSTCTGAQVSTTNGSLTLASGAQIPATGSCTLSVRVKAAADASGGDHVNTIPAGALQTDRGNNADAANATLNVQAPPTLAKTFAPATILRNEVSTLTITLANTNPVALTLSAALTDTFPSGVVIASPANASTTCSGGAGVSTTSGAVSLASGAQIPASGSCTVQVDVTSAAAQSYTNTIATGALQTDFGNNGAAASAVLTVNNPTVPPNATVTPASLSLSTTLSATTSATLTIANSVNSDPLTYSIEAHSTSTPLLLAHGSPNRTQGGQRSSHVTLSSVAVDGQTRTAPWSPTGSIQFQLDDGSYERRVGLGVAANDTESAAVWINRFTVNNALTIDSISILWPAQDVDTLVGRQANLVAYYDADGDGDPSNAVRLGVDTLITIASQDAFETYPTSFDVPGTGDVYVGFVDQWAADGTFSPFLRPAALDQTTSQGKSYVSGAGTPPTDIDVLANNDLNGTIDSFGIPGNWLIRATGSGGPCSGPLVAWLTAAPASGTVAGGANASVTVTADPVASGLASGTYTADLCLTTNDPAHTLIVVPVSLAVSACSSNDEIFCDGFESSAPALARALREGESNAAMEERGARSGRASFATGVHH